MNDISFIQIKNLSFSQLRLLLRTRNIMTNIRKLTLCATVAIIKNIVREAGAKKSYTNLNFYILDFGQKKTINITLSIGVYLSTIFKLKNTILNNNYLTNKNRYILISTE